MLALEAPDCKLHQSSYREQHPWRLLYGVAAQHSDVHLAAPLVDVRARQGWRFIAVVPADIPEVSLLHAGLTSKWQYLMCGTPIFSSHKWFSLQPAANQLCAEQLWTLR